ncbi:MAG: BlaI/MecI/CopY family transcriptional regulator [bacterium]|nr:MAG: BlaI/MecI/CopY family transcriptional regulator [bacterium]
MLRRRVVRFTRREEQIMNILYRRGEASVSDLMNLLPESPTSGAVRRLLNILHGKGAIAYRHDGAKKIYRAAIDKKKAGTKALSHVVDTFFAGSASRTIGALFNNSALKLSNEEKKMLVQLIKKAKEKGR